jgi:hypothetical protein
MRRESRSKWRGNSPSGTLVSIHFGSSFACFTSGPMCWGKLVFLVDWDFLKSKSTWLESWTRSNNIKIATATARLICCLVWVESWGKSTFRVYVLFRVLHYCQFSMGCCNDNSSFICICKMSFVWWILRRRQVRRLPTACRSTSRQSRPTALSSPTARPTA